MVHQPGPAQAAQHARQAIAQHRVQGLPPAAQAAREVTRDQRDASRMLGREGDGMAALGQQQQTEVGTEGRRHGKAQGCQQGRCHQPVVQGGSLQQAAREGEPEKSPPPPRSPTARQSPACCSPGHQETG
ncbi:Uncharacterized protein APZ42_002337 [Daphnia magna]|uniref:Uncharacterized protein n=1 Tax=Daphnia magna TaxID=35525 RepID=A0A164IBS6_9CRUS|nr:Uncharacterized protein APZ42_002337 [Daphnia magna]